VVGRERGRAERENIKKEGVHVVENILYLK